MGSILLHTTSGALGAGVVGGTIGFVGGILMESAEVAPIGTAEIAAENCAAIGGVWGGVSGMYFGITRKSEENTK